jgi:uncharacterized protein (TIGR03437 family)
VKVNIGGFDAVVNYAGAAPTLVAGAMQINAQVPAGILPGAAVPVVVTIGGVRSRTATISVTR